MRRLIRLYRTAFVENRTLTGVVLLFFICVICAISTGFWLAWRLSYVALVGIPIAYAWSRLNLHGIEIIADRSGDRLQEGADYEERITVKNNGWFAKIWLEIDDPSDMPGHRARRVITVPAKGSRTFRVKSTITRRGLYAIGPFVGGVLGAVAGSEAGRRAGLVVINAAEAVVASVLGHGDELAPGPEHPRAIGRGGYA